MGQKIHPVGLRIGIVQKHQSQWFSKPKNYAEFVHQDKIIRDYLSTELRDAGISRILISRRGATDRLFLEVFVAQPKILTGENGARMASLVQELTKRLNKADSEKGQSSPTPYSLSLQVIQVSQEEIPTDARLLAQRVAEQLEKRVAFRRVIKQSIQQARAAGVQGIKIQIAGRLNGAEIARSEWAREGRVPLQTLRANLDYCYHTAQTIYGVLGIKIWIFKGNVEKASTHVGA
jgi:small subunit ribosomal protein S3